MAEVKLPEDKLSASFLFIFAARCPGPGVTISTTTAPLAITNSLSHVSSPFPFISVKVVVEFRWDNCSGGITGRQQAAAEGLGLDTVIWPSRPLVLGWAR